MNPILVAGFHRSGTSWVARCLHLAGVHLGNDLLGAEPSNPYGHFEDEGIIALHDAVLEDQGLTWKSTTGPDRPLTSSFTTAIGSVVSERRSAGVPWAVKDPRICLFLPEWRNAIADLRVIVVIRRPDEAVRSLHRRHARRWVDTRHLDATDTDFWTEPDLGLRLWIHYNEQLLLGLESMNAEHVHLVRWNDRGSTTSMISDIKTKWGLGLKDPELDRDDALGQQDVPRLDVRDAELIKRASNVWLELEQLGSIS